MDSNKNKISLVGKPKTSTHLNDSFADLDETMTFSSNLLSNLQPCYSPAKGHVNKCRSPLVSNKLLSGTHSGTLSFFLIEILRFLIHQLTSCYFAKSNQLRGTFQSVVSGWWAVQNAFLIWLYTICCTKLIRVYMLIRYGFVQRLDHR